MSENGQTRETVPFEVPHPHLKEFLEFLPELNKESDRGMVLIATSYLDELLKRVLLSFFREDRASEILVEGFNAPLGSFSTRIVACTALGLINDHERQEADCVRKIRNHFAHNVHVTFEDRNIKDLCSNLKMAAQPYGDIVVSARGLFSTASVGLIMSLTNRPTYVSRKRLKAVEWQR
ncbi:MltR family transcriptional regulator [Sinorhizobium fredii]|uniref:MltR family transcriptional regulator n=1 Tax=Rhizobium fredii TaxID=380 RepID=UPI000694AA17|nr:MltR family transcriptional regulator [Sinorhizobium fredii]